MEKSIIGEINYWRNQLLEKSIIGDESYPKKGAYRLMKTLLDTQEEEFQENILEKIKKIKKISHMALSTVRLLYLSFF